MAKQKTGRLALQEVPEEGVPGHFAHGLNFYKLFWVFLIGCFAGVVVGKQFSYFSTMAGIGHNSVDVLLGKGFALPGLFLIPCPLLRILWFFRFFLRKILHREL